MFDLSKKTEEDFFWNWFLNHQSEIEIFMHSDFSDFTIYTLTIFLVNSMQ